MTVEKYVTWKELGHPPPFENSTFSSKYNRQAIVNCINGVICYNTTLPPLQLKTLWIKTKSQPTDKQAWHQMGKA